MSLNFDETQSALSACAGKVIRSAEHVQDADFPDDKAWFRLSFTDGTELVIESRQVGSVGQSRGYFAKRLAFFLGLPTHSPTTMNPMTYEPATEVTVWRSDDYPENQS